jgi:hypothetical protein
MADGGFRIEFDGKVVKQCYKVSFDYDEWTYVTNFDAPQPLPDKLKSISVKLEDSSR